MKIIVGFGNKSISRLMYEIMRETYYVDDIGLQH